MSNGTATLTGRAVLLREFEMSDLEVACEIVGDDRVTQWLSFDSKTPEQTREMLDGIIVRRTNNPRSEYYLAIVHREAGRLVGFARLGLDGVKAAKLGFAIHADYWGRGLAADAARTLAGFGFEQLGLHRISAAIGPDNQASVAVVKRIGMTYEDRIRHHVYTNGAWRDSLLYAVLEDQWNKTNGSPHAEQ